MQDMDKQKMEKLKRDRRRGRIRAKVAGSAKRPRVSVFRSNKGMFLQLVDDISGKTLVSAGSGEVKKKDKKTAVSFELGKLIAKKALDPAINGTGKKIKEVVFDRGGYKYHGRVKAAADGAREGGLKF